MEETVFLNEKSVTITNTRAVFNGKTYAISNIAKVSMEKASFPLIGVIMQVVLFVAFLMCVGIGLGIGSALLIIFGVFCIIPFIITIINPNKIFTVMIGTSGSMFDEEVFRSTDQEFIKKIVDTINNAIVNRG